MVIDPKKLKSILLENTQLSRAFGVSLLPSDAEALMQGLFRSLITIVSNQ
jgi:hypothetical protein